MVRNGVVIGLALLAGQAAQAETKAMPDAAGRVVPVKLAFARLAPLCAEAVPLPVDAAKALVARVAEEEKFFPEFVLSVAKVESRYVSNALSEKGAHGLMQLTPETAQRFGVDLCNPEGNVRGGIRFLRVLHERYRNPLFILAAYNAGEDAVRKSRGVPPFPETVRFVADVLNDFYAWPGAAAAPGVVAGGKAPARMAAASLPDIVEIERAGTPDPAGAKPVSGAEPPGSRRPAAAPGWNDGFVMHVD